MSRYTYHRNGTFNNDEHLVRQTNQGLPKILPKHPLEIVSTVTYVNLVIEEKFAKLPVIITNLPFIK